MELLHPVNFADVCRLALFAFGSLLIGLSLAVVVSYARIYRMQQKMSNEGYTSRWKGLLPRHVALIGFSYLGILFFDGLYTLERVGLDFTWRIPLNFLFLAAGWLALSDVMKHSKHRKIQVQGMAHKYARGDDVTGQ